MKKPQQTLALIDIEKVQKRLPPKKPRSHHEVVRLRYVNKSVLVGKNKISILKDIKLVLYSGEFAVIYGPSGCGKSTLLHTIIGLLPPDEGEVFLRGREIYKMNEEERANFRREKIGMVFQQSNWIKSLNCWENVAYPLWLSGFSEEEAKKRALAVID
jgi:putative ABC transport system ATP-binding protein